MSSTFGEDQTFGNCFIFLLNYFKFNENIKLYINFDLIS